MALKLTLKPGQVIRIGDALVRVDHARRGNNRIVVEVEAPRETRVSRVELAQTPQEPVGSRT